MKFNIEVRKVTGGESWTEEYDDSDVLSVDDAKEWATRTLNSFNGSLRPGETAREVISVSIIGESIKKHKFVKMTYGQSVQFQGKVVDLYRCEICGVTGKRYGLQANIRIDSKFKNKVFKTCTEECRSAVSQID